MEITYFYRSLKCGISIKKVFNTLTDEIGKTKEINEIYIPAHRADPISVFRNIGFVFKNRNKKGINHVTGDVHYCLLALIGCTSVLTIHDTSSLDEAKHPLKRMLVKLIWYKLPLLIANRVVCISEHTRQQILKLTNRNDIEVIYNAVDPDFSFQVKAFNIEKPVILHIGTAWNKNLLNTLDAIASLNCHLVIIGEIEDNILNRLKELDITYTNKIFLTNQEIIQEYKNCDIVSFCSLYEGFGMPIIEANATGRAVITSAVPPMNEVAGSAACLVDPTSIPSIKKGFIKIITKDKFRESIIKNGVKNIKKFEISIIAKQYLALYTKVN